MIKEILIFKKLIFLKFGGYLFDVGWIKSFFVGAPVDKNGDPLPWVTYPFIDFIKGRIQKDFNIFEYGSGNSTLFYSSMAKSVDSVEHDRAWFDKIKGRMPINVRLVHKDLEIDGEYCRAVKEFDDDYDVIIIDGRDRVNCVYQSLPHLNDQGVIVLDNSDRSRYDSGINFLLDNGFRRLDFFGMASGRRKGSCTTIFYKEKNCLGI